MYVNGRKIMYITYRNHMQWLHCIRSALSCHHLHTKPLHLPSELLESCVTCTHSLTLGANIKASSRSIGLCPALL